MRKLLLLSIILLLWITKVYSQTSYQGYPITNEGAWCWFADPRAIHYENEEGTINSSYVGYIDVHGNVKAMQMNYLTGQRNEVLVRSGFQPDDHNNPTFLVLPDERVLIIYSRHTDEAAFYYRVSRLPGDITTLGEEKKIVTNHNTTYPSPFILSDDPEHFYLCWRGLSWHPTIAKFSLPDENGDVKTKWGPYQIVQSTGARPYAKYYSNGKDKLYVTYTTGHPDNEQPNWVYFNVININAQTNTEGVVTTQPTLEDIKGNKLSTISSGAFKVYKTADYKSKYPYTIVDSPSNLRDWVWQIVCDNEDRPIIAMVRINGGKSQHEYYYAKWTGSAWRLTDLADGGGKFHPSNTEYCYSGGEAIDPENPNVIYLSIPTVGDSGKSVYEIWKYTLNDAGGIVSKEQITKNSEKNNVRPYILPGSADAKMRLSWMHGDYYYWIVSKNYPAGYPTAIHCDYEWKEEIANPAVLVQKEYASKSMLTADKEELVLPISENEAGFSINVNLQLSESAYYGTLLAGDGFTVGVGQSDAKLYIEIGDTRYVSSNKLYTSDNWATNSSGTSGDNWPTPLKAFNLSLTYDGTQLILYRNGLIEMSLADVTLSRPEKIQVGGYTGLLNSVVAYEGGVSQATLKSLLNQQILQSLSMPAQVTTDLVLPEKLGGEKVEWISDNPEIIRVDGTFIAPETETLVHLTARVQDAERSFEVAALPRDIEKNLLVAYDFEAENLYESNGKKYVKDVSGHRFDLLLQGSASIDGTLNLTANKAVAFSTNGYAVVPAEVMDSLRSYTVLFKATPSSLQAAPRFYDFGYSSGNSLFLRANTLAAGIKYNGGTTTMVSGATALQSGTTYLVAVTFDAATKDTRIYIDGELVGSGTNNQNEAYMIAENAACNRNYIGRTQWWDSSVANDNGDYVGTLDDFCVYNTALTVSEIKSLQGIRQENEELNFDCTAYIQNPGFEASYSVLAGSGVTSDRAIYVPEGWKVNYTNRNENDMSILNSSCLYASLFASVPLTASNEKNAYLVRHKWGTSSIALTQTNDTLPAGYYRLSADMWQSGSGGSGSVWATSDGETVSGTAPTGASDWQTGHVVFSYKGSGEVVLGVTALHTANGSEMFVGFDNLKLTDVTANRSEEEIYELLISMTAVAKEKLSEESLEDIYRQILQQAYEQAQNVSAADAYEVLYDTYKALRNALLLSRNPDVVNGIEVGTLEEEGESDVYDLSGRKLLQGIKNIKDADLENGIYIYNRRKIVVR